MAVTIDQVSLGTQAQSGVSNSTQTTSATVTSGAMIVVFIGGFRSGGGHTHSISTTAGLTWTQAHSQVNSALRLSLFYAFAPSGLASGTTIGVGQSIAGDITWCMNSYLGVDTSGTVVAFNGSSAVAAPWGSGVVAGSAGDAYIGGAWGDGTLRTSTPDAPAVERIDFNSATTSGSNTLVDEIGGSASDALDGDWSGSLDHVCVGVAFKPAAAAASSGAVRTFNAIPFMGRMG